MKKTNKAMKDILAGVITLVIGISIASYWKSDTDWPQVVFYGALIVGGYYVYGGINALQK